MLKLAAGLLLALLLLQGKAPVTVREREVWSVKPPAAASMRVTIGRVETIGDARVVSVTISGIPCPRGQGCRRTAIAHAPIEQATLEAALKRRVGVRAPIDRTFERGYREWKQSEGGFFTLPPHEVGELVIETVLRNGGKLVQER